VEKLEECEGLKISKEELRQIMLARGNGIVGGGGERYIDGEKERPIFGRMVQMDGSYYGWLDERESRMVLMGYIDDAIRRF
jgi:hypothetical protein